MKKAKIILISVLTALALYTEFVLKEMIITYNKIKVMDLKELIAASYSNTLFLLMLIISIALIIFYNKYKDLKTSKPYNIISIFFALFLVFGFSYSVTGDSRLVTSNLILGSVSIIKFYTYYYFLKTVINLLAGKLKTINLKKIKLPKLIKKFENYYEAHPYKTTILILLICWLPYIISFYPAILSPDPSNQIKQYYGLDTHYIHGVKLIDENVVITNHHPVFHTFILGGFTKLGDMLGSVNLGLFFFTIFQMFIVISTMVYTLVYLKKLKVPFIVRFIILIIFALFPVFPLYAMSPVKDTLFGALLVFYILEFHKLIITKEYSIKEYVALSLLLLIMMLVRNNGIYIVLLSFITLIFMLKDKRLSLLIVLLSSLVVYEAHNKILLPTMHITPGSIREMLSVPFQQTARYAKYYGDELSEEEIAKIDKILGYETLAERYKPNIADPVKNEFNPNSNMSDLMDYFGVWASDLIKHPGVYIDATINTTYGYFYPNTSNWYVYHEYDKRLIKSGIDYHYNNLEVPRDILTSYAVSFPYIPIIGSLVNIGFVVWTYIFLLAYLISEKKKRLIPLLLPAFILLLTCVVGPVNTYFRYMFPIVISLPLIIGLLLGESKTSNRKLKKIKS